MHMARWWALAGAGLVVCSTHAQEANSGPGRAPPASDDGSVVESAPPTQAESAPGPGDSSDPRGSGAPVERRVRPALAGPTSPAGYRDPFGLRGSHIFAPLDWPAPSERRLASGAPGPDYWQQQVDYRIDAALDAEARSISASATITYHNNSPHRLTYLWMHLEQNLFRSDSIGALTTEPESRFGFRKGTHGGFDLAFVRAGGADLPMQVYDTMGRIDLPEPIEPGETFRFEIAWSYTVPQMGADRTAVEEVEQGTIFEIAQWFPAVACYDDVDGWNTLGYVGQGEFYTNFGDYEVAITVPRSHIVVASGQLLNPEQVLTEDQHSRLRAALASDETIVIRSAEEVGDPSSRPPGQGPLTWRFQSQSMRTFAWASSDAFIYDAAGLDVKGSRYAPNGRVVVQAAYPKEAVEVWSKAVQMARHSIGFNSTMWHPYPYPTATNVNGTVGGMEYPGFVMCGGRRSERGLYGVTNHEFGHTWFPMMVNTDERRYAWMDEGFNSFINMFAGADYREPGSSPGPETARVGRGVPRANQQPIMSYPDQMRPGQLGPIGYSKPANGLFLLREFVLGHERFDRAFKEYVARWAFKSPQPSDFFRTMEDVAGMDLSWFWRGWFYGNGTLDQAIAGVEQVEDADERAEGEQAWVYVDLANRSEMVMPARLRVTFDNDSTRTIDLPVQIWAATNEWTAGFDPQGRTVTKVVIDPDHLLPDADRSNNAWPEPEPEPEPRGPGRFRGRGGAGGTEGSE